MQSSSVFADFPEDVARTILETAAAACNWNCALVSKEVKAFAEPLLYRRIELVKSSQSKLALLHRTVLDHPSKEDDFFAAHVKMIVCIWADLVPDQALVVLEACKGVKRMVYIPDDDASPVPQFLEDMHAYLSKVTQCAPTQMCIWAKGLPRDQRTFSSPIFRNVTHLSVVLVFEWGWDWDWSNLSLLKSLTHLSINDTNGQIHHEHIFDIVKQVLSVVEPTLRILVVHTSGLEGAMGPMAFTFMHRLDPRIVVASTEKTAEWFESTFMSGMGPYFRYSLADHTDDWFGASSHPNNSPSRGFWAQAENALQGDEGLRKAKVNIAEQDLMAVVEHIITGMQNPLVRSALPQQEAHTAEGDQPPLLTCSEFIVEVLKGRARLPGPDNLTRAFADGQTDNEVISDEAPHDSTYL